MINLLGNAIKFTESGSISVIASLQDDWLHLDVKDTGCGIPKEQLDTIFETFRQGDGSETKQHGGTGLGLAIVKQIITSHEGTIVHTRPPTNTGTAFVISLPLP